MGPPQTVDKVHRKKKLHKTILQLKVFARLFQKAAGIPKGRRPFGRTPQRVEHLFLRKKLRRGAETVRGTVSARGTLARGSPKKFCYLCNLTFQKPFFTR